MGSKFKSIAFAPVDAAGFARPHGPVRLPLHPALDVRIRNHSQLDAPAFPSRARKATFARLAYEAPALDLFSLPDATFHGLPSFFSHEGKIVDRSFLHWSPVAPDPAPLLRQMARANGPPRRLPGRYLLGMSEFAYNFYHWHVDILPAVLFLARLGLMDETKVLIHGPTGFLVESLKHLGVPLERIVGIAHDAPTVVDELVFASTHDNHGGQKHPAAMQVFAAIKAGAPGVESARPPLRLFASRGGSMRRALGNRPAVEAAFTAAGFLVIDPSTLPYLDQLKLFHDAEVVVGEHGANLAAVGFCQAGALVVELCHPVHSDLAYLALTETLGLAHRMLLGAPQDGEAWTVDPSVAVAFTLDAMDRRTLWLERLATISPAG